MTYIDIDDARFELSVLPPIHVCDPSWSWYHKRGGTPAWPFIVWLVLGGECTLEVDNEDVYTVQHGDAYLLPMREHSYTGLHNPKRPLDVIWFAFSISSEDLDNSRHTEIVGIPFQIRLSDFESCSMIMARLMDSGETSRKHWAYCLLHEMRRQSALESGSPTDLAIRKIASEMKKAPGTFHGLSDMMSGLYMSKDHFIRKFRNAIGVSPGEYLIRCRMDRARSLLAMGNHSVKETAEALGYSHQTVFSRQFRERIGISPRNYSAQMLSSSQAGDSK